MRRLKIENTNVCNSHCLFCAYELMTRDKGFMTMELFEKVVKEYASIGGGRLTISPIVGDTLLDDKFLERLRFCCRFNEINVVGFHTNLIALDRWKDEEVAEISKLCNIWCVSFGPNRDLHRGLFGVDEFDHVVDNLARLYSLADDSCDIHLNGKAAGGPLEIDEKLQKVISGKREASWRSEYCNWGGCLGSQELIPIQETGDWKREMEPCEWGKYPAVLWDGRVSFCGCADFDARLLIGDVKSTSLEKILDGEKRKHYYNSFRTPDLNHFCKDCSFYHSERP